MKHDYSRSGLLMFSHPLTNFEIQSFYQNKPKLNGVYSRNNLPKIKSGAYVINLDENKSIGTNWIGRALHVNGDNVTYFDTFGIKNKQQNPQATKISKQIFVEYKQMIQ